MNLADELQTLRILRDEGALTDDEHTAAHKRVLECAASPFKPRAEAPIPPPQPASSLNQFRRSLTDRWIGGVAGGLGAITGIPSWTWRILFLLTTFLHGLGLVMYILLWIFVPVESEAPRPVAPMRT